MVRLTNLYKVQILMVIEEAFPQCCWNFSFQNILMDQNLLLEMHLE